MSRSSWVLRSAEALRKRAKDSGQLSAAERLAGVKSGYLRKLANRGFERMPIGRFLEILKGIGEHPGEFFAEVFPISKRQAVAALVDEPRGAAPKVVRKARERLTTEDFGGPLGADYLLQLDELRYDQPAEVAQKIEDAIGLVEWPWVPLALGVYASACRPLQRLDDGRHALREGLGIAHLSDQPLAIGDLVQRATFLSCEQSDYERALELNEHALALYVRQVEINRMGRALADRGYILGNLERYDESAEAFRGALRLLDDDERRHRYCCHHGLTVVHSQTGALAEALAELDAATELVTNDYQRGKLDWARAGTLISLDRSGDALACFERAFDALSAHPVAAALCHCDHVRTLLDLGRISEAVTRSRAARALLVPLEEESRIAAAAMRDLLLSGMEGERRLTVRLVDEVKRRISEGSGPATRSARRKR